MPDVFISYNREDQPRARAIAVALEAEGLSVWWDSNLRAGESYDEVTERNLRGAGAVVVLWSKRSVASKWVRAEATVGERCSTLVPAMIEECERPLRFELIQTADLSRWHGERNDRNWQTFVHDIRAAVGHHGKAHAPASAPATAPGNGDLTIENTFWTSIKDGTDRQDFEAYLKRYPHGHFADLARNRLAALERKAAAPPPVQPAPRTSPSTTHAAAPQRASAPASRPAASGKSGPNVALIGAFVFGALVIGGGAYFAINRGAPAASEPGTIAAPEAAEEMLASENATDEPAAGPETLAVLSDGALDAAEPPGDAPLDEVVESLAAVDDTGQALAAEEIATVSEAIEASDVAAPSGAATFTDCEVCPLMAELPAGSFTMGSPADEPGRFGYEGPQHEVKIRAFAIGVHEVTFDQWAACVDDGGCGGYRPGDAGFGRGARPALYISWADAKAYAKWLSKKTGRTYRLPTESEWEYAARGGTPTAYWWGDRFDNSKTPSGQTAEVGSFSANAFGLYDMLGNASEWVEDCYVNNYAAAPTDGAPVLNGDCGRRVVRGGNWRSEAGDLRAANRRRITVNVRDRSLGFRVAADLR